MKKILIGLLSILIIFIGNSAFTASAAVSGDYGYKVENGNVTITKYKGMADNLSIPDTLDGYPVTSIGDFSFGYCRDLTSVTIPGSVTKIGNWAFTDCTSLTALTIPDSITEIGEWAFTNCKALTSITIPGGVTKVDSGDFSGCKGLTTVTFNGSNTRFLEVGYSLPEGQGGSGPYCAATFSGCTNLTTFYGYLGSPAEKYAIEKGINFIPLDDTDEEQEGSISVFCNGTELGFDQPPILENDRILVPMRAIFESLGALVDWEQETKTVTAVKDDTKITLQIGSDILYKNGEEIQLDVPAKLLNSRTLVPIRAVSEAFGANVEWLDKEQKVIISI